MKIHCFNRLFHKETKWFFHIYCMLVYPRVTLGCFSWPWRVRRRNGVVNASLPARSIGCFKQLVSRQSAWWRNIFFIFGCLWKTNTRVTKMKECRAFFEASIHKLWFITTNYVNSRKDELLASTEMFIFSFWMGKHRQSKTILYQGAPHHEFQGSETADCLVLLSMNLRHRQGWPVPFKDTWCAKSRYCLIHRASGQFTSVQG